MKKFLVGITLCVILVLCLSSPVSAGVTNQWYGGDRVVYDMSRGTYWYPHLKADGLFNQTRANQEAFIADLNKEGYGGISDWQMASWSQTRGLKTTLSYMGTERMPWQFGAPLEPQLEDRDAGSPYLAWGVSPDAFFDVTGHADMTFLGLPRSQIFNGRTADDGWGWLNDRGGDGLVWVQGDADDHFMVHDLCTPGEYGTMMFNYDQHPLGDLATASDFLGSPFLGGESSGVGAWIVSTSRPVAVPAPGTLLLGSMGVGVVGYLRRRRTL